MTDKELKERLTDIATCLRKTEKEVVEVIAISLSEATQMLQQAKAMPEFLGVVASYTSGNWGIVVTF